MFSVLMSLYNRENTEYLDACLDSLDKQTLKASEVVIVYDGFIDKNLNRVVKKYINALNIKIVKLPVNVGLGDALNEGIKHCSFDIIARMDTDDICHANRFEIQIPIIHSSSQIALVGSAVTEFDEDGNRRLKELPIDINTIKKFSILKNPFNHMSVVFRRVAVERAGGYKHHLYMEDYNLWLRMLAQNNMMINIRDNLLDVRVGRDMLTKRRGLKYIKSEYLLFKLKNELKLTPVIKGVVIFCIRSIPRILPIKILAVCYDKDRKGHKGKKNEVI